MIETPIDEARGHNAGGKNSRAYEHPAIEINSRVGYLASGYFVRFLQRINNE